MEEAFEAKCCWRWLVVVVRSFMFYFFRKLFFTWEICNEKERKIVIRHCCTQHGDVISRNNKVHIHYQEHYAQHFRNDFFLRLPFSHPWKLERCISASVYVLSSLFASGSLIQTHTQTANWRKRVGEMKTQSETSGFMVFIFRWSFFFLVLFMFHEWSRSTIAFVYLS